MASLADDLHADQIAISCRALIALSNHEFAIHIFLINRD